MPAVQSAIISLINIPVRANAIFYILCYNYISVFPLYRHEPAPRIQAVPLVPPLHGLRAGRAKAIVQGEGPTAGEQIYI